MSADHPATAIHEIRGNVCYAEYGDSPYWAMRTLVHTALDEDRTTFDLEIDGEEWNVSVGAQKSGLEPRRTDDVESLREYRITAYGRDERKLPLLIQPRLDWDDPSRRPRSVPSDLGLATNVRLETATNLEPEEIEDLIPRIMRGLATEIGISWNRRYFTGRPHQYSTIVQYERYARALRELAMKIVRSDGIFYRIFNLLADEKGSKFVFSADNTEAIGYNHQLRLNRSAVAKLTPDGVRPGCQIKHYHPEHVRKKDDSDPLYHPKIGVLFKKGWNDDEAIPWHEHRRLRQQVEELLMNVLQWADVPTECGPTFVSDWHFDASEPSDVEIALYDDPTPSIETDQDSVLVSTLSRLSDRDVDVLDRVARADGGAHVGEIEAETDWASSTIYRALQTLGDLLENENGNVSFISQRIRDRVRKLLDQLDATVDPIVRIIEDTLEVDPRDLERAGRAWQNWLRRYGAELVRRGERPGETAKIRIRELLSTFKSSSYEHVGEVLDYGLIAWMRAGRDPAAFENATVVFDDADAGETQADSARWLIERYGTG